MFTQGPQRARRIVFALMALIAVLSLPLISVYGQSGSAGTLSGVVHDPNGADLPGVNVTARNVTTGATRTVVTNSEGRWAIPGLAIGNYQLSYELEGFKKLIREGVSVEASVPRTLDDTL